MKKYLLISILGVFLLSSCDKTPEGTTTSITKSVFSGYVQKGPYVNGSGIIITPLDENLKQTGKVFSSQIIDNSGDFEGREIEFASNFVELKADGYYFNEVTGGTSTGTLVLYALADITDINSVNINVLTHLERQRMIYLIQDNGLSFSAAKKQARGEVLNIFKFALPEDVATESLNITNDALLLAVSVIVQGHLSTGDMSKLLANISADIREDGKLDNPALGTQLMNNAAFLDLDKVISNMEKEYSELGITVNINSTELSDYVKQFKDNCGFEQTLNIIYSETGKHGPNILAENFVEGKSYEDGKPKAYSIKAELPAGNSSLKVLIRGKAPFQCSQCGNVFSEKLGICPLCGGLIYENSCIGHKSSTAENWLVTKGSSNTIFIFTVVDSGKPSETSITISNDFIIEYYENGATEPTKVKEVKVIKVID